MSEKMVPIPFRQLMTWIADEYSDRGSVFGVQEPYRAGEKTLPIFGERLETPIGPAAGPNTQLAQNIIAAYFGGARFFELKTVQKMDGDELAACIGRPCILAEDECYNCEWSTELFVPQAYEEYVKAWCALKILSGVYGLGRPDGFVFNMSVGYDLEGIRGEKIDRYLRGMTDASREPIWSECISVLKELYPRYAEYIDTISPRVSRSVTVSTLHGCPPDEIERIASYLITEKGLNTYVKCNPTILGYESARSILDGMGYDYVSFDEHHFREDLQYEDAIPMFRRLQELAEKNGVEFGLKLSNTFPVEVKRKELPSEEMYMAGKALFPLTIEMANRIGSAFGGRLRLSYSGGADALNVEKLFACNIWPITVATTILKPGGYQRLKQMAEKLETHPFRPFTSVDTEKIAALALEIRRDRHHVKAVKPLPSRKLPKHVPLFDCFTAPCRERCPIGQDVPEYLELCRKKDYRQALEVILSKNPLPFITGTICAHHCMDVCTRNFYEDPIQIRAAKLVAAENGYPAVLADMKTPVKRTDVKAAIIGGGPTGMAAAHFLARAGLPVTIFEREKELGGIVRYVIPEFRISRDAIDKDVSFLQRLGVELRTGAEAPSVDDLKQQGYTHILFAIGAWKPGRLEIPGNVKPVIDWMKSVKAGNREPLGHVAVIGGGNTAMDAARLALRAGAESSTLVYRRTKKYMPADAEELELAIADGVRFLELVSPVKQENGILYCRKMALGEPDESGRRSVRETDETCRIPCDTVISAVGEMVDGAALTASGVELDAKGRPALQTNVPGVYTAGDAHRGPATVVEGIADAAAFAQAVLGETRPAPLPETSQVTDRYAISKKGILAESAKCEGDRCLHCATVCQCCADVCPNRANVVILLADGRRQILHVDRMCNECGNCQVFCPYSSAPYKDKFTLFHDREGFDKSPENSGFLPLGGKKVLVRLNGTVREYDLDQPNDLPADAEMLMLTVLEKYGYLI